MKILLFLVLLSSIILMSSSVIALNQNVTATVNETTIGSVTPDILDFGQVILCSQNNAKNGPIIFSGAGSNTNVSIEFTSVTPGLFQGISVAQQGTNQTWIPITDHPKVNLPCVNIEGLCTYTNVLFDARLNVPCGTAPGVQSGVITYTVTGTTPPTI